MYVSSRAALVRNIAIAIANGSITLVILLIAPLGLATVIINTLLITVASFGSALAADRTIAYLQPQRSSRATADRHYDNNPEENLVTSQHRSHHIDRR
jgi:hypothetical protein